MICSQRSLNWIKKWPETFPGYVRCIEYIADHNGFRIVSTKLIAPPYDEYESPDYEPAPPYDEYESLDYEPNPELATEEISTEPTRQPLLEQTSPGLSTTTVTYERAANDEYTINPSDLR